MAAVTAAPAPRRARRPVEHGSVEERTAAGRAARKAVPRSTHGEWAPAPDRQDPLEILQAQATTRLTELVPIRYGRMVETPFAFYRGGAAIMSADLAPVPSTGLTVQLCGDAHLSNFGTFAGPDRRLLFDLNDFDETLPGPFEWDVKRLAASFEVACRHRGLGRSQRRKAVLECAASYRRAMRRLAGMRTLDVWYQRIDVENVMADLKLQGIAGAKGVRNLDRYVAKSRRKDNLRALSRLTTVVDGEPRFQSQPPLLVPVRELFSEDDRAELEGALRGYLRAYRNTLPASHRLLLDRYRFADMARKVVGVGSVGTRAWVLLMFGRDASDPLILQVKEAQASVLEPYLGASAYKEHGRRVVEGQRLMQAASDVMLGWLTGLDPDGIRRDFYVRQLWDAKGSIDLDVMLVERFPQYAQICGAALARAHARSGDPVAIAAYLGGGDAFDEAMVAFAIAYADVNEQDHALLEQAAQSGVIGVQRGV